MLRYQPQNCTMALYFCQPFLRPSWNVFTLLGTLAILQCSVLACSSTWAWLASCRGRGCRRRRRSLRERRPSWRPPSACTSRRTHPPPETSAPPPAKAASTSKAAEAMPSSSWWGGKTTGALGRHCSVACCHKRTSSLFSPAALAEAGLDLTLSLSIAVMVEVMLFRRIIISAPRKHKTNTDDSLTLTDCSP